MPDEDRKPVASGGLLRLWATLSREGSLSEDTPLRLDVAAVLAIPEGSMTARGLRMEASKGSLALERIAGKYYTTLRDIREMRALCRLPASAGGSSHDRSASRRQPSEQQIKSAQAAALATIEELHKR